MIKDTESEHTQNNCCCTASVAPQCSAESVKCGIETRAPGPKGTCCGHIFVILPAVNQEDGEDKIVWRDNVLRSVSHEAVSRRVKYKVLQARCFSSTLQRSFKSIYGILAAQVTFSLDCGLNSEMAESEPSG